MDAHIFIVFVYSGGFLGCFSGLLSFSILFSLKKRLLLCLGTSLLLGLNAGLFFRLKSGLFSQSSSFVNNLLKLISIKLVYNILSVYLPLDDLLKAS